VLVVQVEHPLLVLHLMGFLVLIHPLLVVLHLLFLHLRVLYLLVVGMVERKQAAQMGDQEEAVVAGPLFRMAEA
jgi:hypothetical protein